MNTIDKNDVSIDKLFQWRGKLKIYNRFNREILTAYIRLAGDAEINRARVFALRKSSELRKKLKDLNSDERLAYIPDISVLDRDTLIEVLILFRTRELTLEAIKEINIPLPKEPDSDASLEEQEEYQKIVDEYPTKREEAIKEHVNKKLDIERQTLSQKTTEELYKNYETQLINQLCEDEMIKRYREMCVYFGSYRDENYTERLFSSFDEFDNLPPEIKEQFLDYYTALDLSGEDLKKLPEAMQ